MLKKITNRLMIELACKVLIPALFGVACSWYFCTEFQKPVKKIPAKLVKEMNYLNNENNYAATIMAQHETLKILKKMNFGFRNNETGKGNKK